MEENKTMNEQKKENFFKKVWNNKYVRKTGRVLLDLATIADSLALGACFFSAARDAKSSVKTISTKETEVKATPTVESHES